MNLKLIRTPHDGFTKGKLYVNGEFQCYTVEDQDRKLESVGCEAKVYGKTCIPRGNYELIIRYSNHFKKFLIAVTGVKCFEGVLIHSGNSSKDTEGCIIVGAINDHEDQDWIGSSRTAYESLHQLVKRSLSLGNKVYLEIV